MAIKINIPTPMRQHTGGMAEVAATVFEGLGLDLSARLPGPENRPMPLTEADPVSELFDAGARRLLERAYARPGAWAGTRLANPAPRHVTYLAALGINPMGPDDKSGAGRLNARTRWARGFVRSLYYQHRWFSDAPGGGWRPARRLQPRRDLGLEVEVGRAMPGGRQAGTVLLAGRAVRVRAMASPEPQGRAYTEGDGQSVAARRTWEGG